MIPDHQVSRRVVAATLLLAAFAAGILFATRAKEQTADSLDYAGSARSGAGMYHPHHLLFVPAVRLTMQALGGSDGSPDPIRAGQFHNILWALVAVGSLFLIAERFLDSTRGALAVALCLLFARCFWLYSTQLEVYVPATGCLALLTAILLHLPPGPMPAGRGAILTLLLSAAILYHQSNLFFGLPLGIALLARPGGRLRDLRIVAVAGALVLGAYLLAFRFADVESRIPDLLSKTSRSPGDFVRFCLAYKFHPSPGWGTWRNFSVMGVGRLLHSQIRTLFSFPWSLRAVVIPGFSAAVAGLIGWHFFALIRGREPVPERGFALAWLVTYDLFFLWWFPGEKEFFITTLIPLLLLVALAAGEFLNRPDGAVRGRTVAFRIASFIPLLLAAVNAKETILPYHHDRGPAYAAASALARRVPAECLVMGDYSVGENLRYYFGREKVMETAMPLFFFYRGEAMPPRYRIETETCVAADLSFVTPDYSLGGFDGHNHPEEWSGFTAWLLGFDSDAARGGYHSRSLEGIGAVEGSPYVLLRSPGEPAEGIRPIFRRLDDAMRSVSPGARPFEAWLDSETPHSLP